MIVFNRFLCCINLKLFGKIFGWTGAMISLMSAYVVFLIATGRKTAGKNDESNHMIFGKELNIREFYYHAALIISLLLIIAAFHILLICGIKYRKSICIVPYVTLFVILTSTLICILPSEVHLSASNEHQSTSIYIIISFILTLILSVYITLCFYSLYELIKCEEKRRKLYKNVDTIIIAPLPI